MTREDLEAYIHNQFEDTTTNTPWTQFPHYKVFRHQGNHKWFALVMNITTDKLGMISCIVLFNIYEITFTYTRNIIDAPAKSTPYTIPMIIICIDVVFNI